MQNRSQKIDVTNDHAANCGPTSSGDDKFDESDHQHVFD